MLIFFILEGTRIKCHAIEMTFMKVILELHSFDFSASRYYSDN